jgi:hypothetical protein
MARKMKSPHGEVFTVHSHIITRNFWEYYILDNYKDRDIRFALVMGFETEMGDVSMSEIAPYIATRTDNLQGVMSAPGWEWVK